MRSENPVMATNDPARGIRLERVLDDAEIKVIWDACPDDRFGEVSSFLLYAALKRRDRRVALVGMDWTGIYLIPGERTESRKALILTSAGRRRALEILAVRTAARW